MPPADLKRFYLAMPGTKTQLARKVGVARATVTRAFARMNKESYHISGWQVIPKTSKMSPIYSSGKGKDAEYPLSAVLVKEVGASRNRLPPSDEITSALFGNYRPNARQEGKDENDE